MKKLIFAIIGLFLFLITLIAGDGFIQDSIPEGNNYGVIYGNKVNSDGTLSIRLQERLDTANDLYIYGIIQKILVSGGTGVEGYDEAEVMKQYLVEKGISKLDILLDSNGYTTRKTSKNTWNTLGNEDNISIVGISQFFHISRIKLSLSQEGFNRVYGYSTRYFEVRDFYSLLRELPAYIRYLIN